MPLNVFTNTDNTAVTGSLTVVNDTAGGTGASGNVNIAGTLVTSGTASFASGVTASSLSIGGLNAAIGPLTVTSGMSYDFVSGSTNAPTTASSQSLSAASGVITMTSGLTNGTGPHVIYVSANSTTVSAVTLTPTSSASTSGVFQNGVEITVVNLAASGSRVNITAPGSLTTDAILVSGGHSVRFVYNASCQTWIPLTN